MSPRVAATCLLACLLAPTCYGAGTEAKAKAKAKAKDPWDVPDGSEDVEGAPMGSMQSEMSPEDQAGIMQQVAERSAKRRAHNQHQVMSQFMHQFANNMRLSVLADSKGDMPEAKRQELIAKAESERAASNGDQPPAEQPPAEEEEQYAPPPPRRAPRRQHRMLNMAEARHQRAMRAPPRHHPSHRLLPEAEGIGFPAPEGMATDPATEGMVNDPGMTSEGGESYESEAPPPPPRPRPRRHHLHMLNVRPGETRRMPHPHHHAASKHQLPPGVVRDEMGRAMPVLFSGMPPKSGAFRTMLAPLSVMAIACIFLVLS